MLDEFLLALTSDYYHPVLAAAACEAVAECYDSEVVGVVIRTMVLMAELEASLN